MKNESKVKWLLAGLLVLVAAFGVTSAHAFTLSVVDEAGVPVSGFRWLVEEDTTHPVTPGAHVADSLSVSIHKSYAPVVASGSTPGSSAVITTDINGVTLDPTKRYTITVLTIDNTHTLGGGSVGDLDTNGVLDDLEVTINTLPIPTAQVSILVFHDNRPISNAPDIPFEEGLANFSIFFYDQGGTVSMDAFGNPLGTTYDALGNVVTLGDGTVVTDANGEAVIKYLPPGKYGVRAIPPHNENWIQTSTIEGTPGIDTWVKANEPLQLIEFGPPFPHVFIGFVQEMDLLSTLPVTGTPGTVTGQIITAHSSRPPSVDINLGYPVSECWVGLNTTAGDGVYVAPCNPDSTFTINGVPPGTYQLVMWDTPLLYIFGFTTVTVPDTGGTVDIGQVTMNAWFGTYEGSVFHDTNQNGIRDCVTSDCNNNAAGDEVGIVDQALNIRFRDGSIYQSAPSDIYGEFSFTEVFPFFKFMVYEVDFARFKPTGATIVVDDGGPLAPGAKNNPQLQPENGNLPYRIETGPILLEAMTLYADQTNTIDWGKVAYGPGPDGIDGTPDDENGGITGVIYYAVTRAENDPRLAAAETWEPGIPRVQVNLYQDFNLDNVIDDIDGNPGIQLADVDNYPFGNFPGPEDIDRNYAGQTVGNFDMGDAYQVATTDSWDDNLPTGCVGPIQTAFGQPLIDCAETLQTWNQTRPAVFDGGYAFGFAVEDFIPAGTYIVEAVPPPGYEIVKEEDKNVDFGEFYQVSPLLLPPTCVGTTANLQPVHVVPAELSLFPGVPALNAGATTPLCNMKELKLSAGQNAAADFHLFTEVPKAARGVGIINNDLAITLDPSSPVLSEKSPAAWVPISVQDWAGHEITRTYSDEWGAYNFLVPSTFTINPPIPTGVSPNMLRVCLNHPYKTDPATGLPVQDPWFSPQYSQTCYTLDFWPGKTTYLDTPIIPTAAFTGAFTSSLDCELSDGTPVISDVTAPGAIGPYASVADGSVTITITSPGNVDVPNPDCGTSDPTCSNIVSRDFGFGTTQGTVTVGGTELTITSWANLVITGTVPTGMTTGQLVVTRGDNNKESLNGVTLTVGGPAPTVVTPGAGAIQAAIDAASTGDLIIVRPGTYNEVVIMWKNVQLQGSGITTVINAAPIVPEDLQTWRNNIDALIGGSFVSLIPGEDAAVHIEPAGITVIANDGVFTSSPRGRIDGFTIASATSGGAISVNGYAHYLEISNNRIINNAGSYGGGIRIGTPSLLDPSCVDGNSNPTYCSSANDNVYVHNNHITQNGSVGGITGGGGIGIFNGADNYQVVNNYICGNFSVNHGSGIAHVGLSDNGLIASNKILLNETAFGTLTGGSAGGILIAGEVAPAGATGGLTPGAGNVTINSNLIQSNLAGNGYGGGILTSFVNGQDVFAAPTDNTNWYSVNILNNIIVNNVAGFAGGGIFLEDTAKAFIVNNTVAENESTATGANAFLAGATSASTPQPAGIVGNAHSAGLIGLSGSGFTQTFSNPVIDDDIVWSNRSYYYDPAANGGAGGLVANASMLYWDLGVINTAGALNPLNSILTDTTGYSGSNSANNPLFVSEYANVLQTAIAPQEGGNMVSITLSILKPFGDYHIRAGSPAINLGAGTYLAQFTELGQDYDGDTRPNGASSDAGADEQYAGYVPPIPLGDRVGTVRGSRWYLDANGNDQWDGVPIDLLLTFGRASDKKVYGDWNGDGNTNVGVVRGSRWYLDTNGNGVWEPGTDTTFNFGIPSDIPVTGDWNGDGTASAGVLRGNRWYLDVNGNGIWEPGTDSTFLFGTAGDTPVTGDWNGDGITDVGVVNGTTWTLDSDGDRVLNPLNDQTFDLGAVAGTPITGDWNADGITETGIFNSGAWLLDLDGNNIYDDCPAAGCFRFGVAADTPVAGKW